MLKSITYLLKIPTLIFLLLTDITPQDPICIVNYFGTIEVTPDIVLNGAGENIDTIEFWKAPDITESLMFVTAKDNSLVEVWKYPFDIDDEQTPLTHSTFGSGAWVNGAQVDQEANLLFVSIGSPESSVSVFTLPDLQFLTEFNSNGVTYHTEPNLTLLELTNNEKQLYVSTGSIVYFHNVTDTASPDFGDYIDSFPTLMEIETLQADKYHQNIMIPDEDNQTGVYAYYPDGTPYPDSGANNFGNGVFQSDAEGILLYSCSSTGDGFFVVSDQIDTPLNEYEFFDRQTWIHLGTMKITSVNRTDGVASFPYSSFEYPMGLFAAIDRDGKTVLTNWDKIFTEIENNGGLPVELESFTAEVIDGKVLLKWITQTEVDNYGFEIERSADHKKWQKIGFVEGHGNSNSPKSYSFTDINPVGGSMFKYLLKQIDTDGNYEYSKVIEINFGTPTKLELSQNYPNPFNPSTNIKYSVPANGQVKLAVYNLVGEEIVILVNENRAAGFYKITFDAADLPSGTYFYKLDIPGAIQVKKMMLLK